MPQHSNFTHLHVHTQYSLLDGACQIGPLLDLAINYKMPSIAITDHGNMFGAIEFYQQAMARGIKPIIGCEVYIAPDSRFEKSSHGIQEASFHLILLAKDEEGYKNLMKLVSIGYLEGFYYRPRIDKEVLQQHSKGLIGLSACLQGEIPHLIQSEQTNQAQTVAGQFNEIFGKGNFYLELQDNRIPEQEKVNKELIKMAKELNIDLVATNDVHYLIKEKAKAHEVLLCIQTQTTLDDPNRMKFQTDEFYFKSPERMEHAFSEVPEAINNTIQIVEKCNLELDFKKTYLPHYKPPEGKSREDYLIELCQEGLKEKYGKINEDIRKRFEHELDIIKKLGYTSYFLITRDFVHYAREKSIPVGPGRGSAAGSIVSYALGITDIDPLKYGLLFERFLNPDRISLPDIDIDFCYERRNEVIDYVVSKYSKDNVAQIITFGTMMAKGVIRDVARVMGMPYAEADRIAKLIPNDLNITLAQALEAEPELKTLYKTNPQITQLIDISLALEGLTRHASTHAAGVVISEDKLTNHAPLFKISDGQVTTGYPMTSLEKIGLLKMDFLGLRTLTVIDETCKIVKRTQEKEIDIEKIPLDDKKTFKILSNAESIGMFQLESSGMRDLLKKLKPEKMEDIIALLALFRPGPIGSGMLDDFMKRKHRQIQIRYDHKILEPILKETYGIIVYQEQVMSIASEIAGFSMAEADRLRRAMSKKTPEILADARKRFVEGARKKGIDKRIADKIFDQMEYFGGYGFNKCVIGSTELIDADTGRLITIEKLYKNKRLCNTLSCDKNFRIVKRPICKVMRNGRKKVYRLMTSLGKEIVVTDNHPFLTFDDWKELKDLVVGEFIASPRELPIKVKDNEINSFWEDYKIITLAGVLSEGNTCHPSGIYYYNNKREQINDFVQNVKYFSRTKPRVYTRPDGRFEVYVGTRRDTKFTKDSVPWNRNSPFGNPVTVKSVRSAARLWIENLGLAYKKATEKFIPNKIFSLPSDKVALFIGRLWSGDGFICDENNKVPYYATSSKRLAYQLQVLLLRFGILSRIAKKSFNYKRENRIGYTIYLQGRDSIKSFLSKVCPHMVNREDKMAAFVKYYDSVKENLESKDVIPAAIKNVVKEERLKANLSWCELEARSHVCMKEFYGRIKSYKFGFRRNTIKKLAAFLDSKELFKYATSDIYWERVTSIEYVGEEETYDVEVDDTHNFIANGIIVHNSHSAAYALISYRTAYLKANFPVEFMTALLTSERDNTDKIALYIDELNRMGIRILPPDVNESFANFTVVGEDIRFGLTAVKNVGTGAVDSIIESRMKYGKFKSLYDFCERVNSRLVNRKVIESLIKCGAFDSLGLYRSQQVAILDKALEVAGGIQKDRMNGQLSFFDTFENQDDFKKTFQETPNIPEWPESQLLSYEKAMLGFYITRHPLTRYEKLIKSYSTSSTMNLTNFRDGQEIIMGGIINKLKITTTKKTGEKMAIISVEDLDGVVEVLVFPSSFPNLAKHIKMDAILFVKGKLSLREDEPRIIASEMIPVDEVREKLTKAVYITMVSAGLEKTALESLKDILTKYPGNLPVYLNFLKPDKNITEVLLGEDFRITPTDKFVTDVENLLGTGVINFKN